jgi:glutamine amidotransferase
MGWNRLRLRRESTLLDGVDDGAQVYFVHGYAVDAGAATVASCDHGGTFSAAVQRGNISGMQFHPERSGPVGQRLLANFLGVA